MSNVPSIGINIVETLPNVQNVGEGSRFVVSVPTGVKALKAVGLELSGTTFTSAHIDTLEVLANGKPLMQYREAAHIENLQGYYGVNVATGRLLVDFDRKHLTQALDREKFLLGLADVSTLQIQGNIAGSTAPAVSAYEQKTALRKPDDKAEQVRRRNQLGLFTKVKNFVYTLSGAGTTEIDNIPREAWLQAMHLIQSSDVVTNVEVWVDGRKVWDASKARMEQVCEDAGRTRQTATYHIDWMLENELGGQLPLAGVQDFRLKIEHSGAATLSVYAEYLSSFSGI